MENQLAVGGIVPDDLQPLGQSAAVPMRRAHGDTSGVHEREIVEAQYGIADEPGPATHPEDGFQVLTARLDGQLVEAVHRSADPLEAAPGGELSELHDGDLEGASVFGGHIPVLPDGDVPEPLPVRLHLFSPLGWHNFTSSGKVAPGTQVFRGRRNSAGLRPARVRGPRKMNVLSSAGALRGGGLLVHPGVLGDLDDPVETCAP